MGYELFQALGSACCDNTHTRQGARFPDITNETGGAICAGHSVLCLVISHTRQRVRFVLWALDSASCDITHKTKNSVSYRL